MVVTFIFATSDESAVCSRAYAGRWLFPLLGRMFLLAACLTTPALAQLLLSPSCPS